MRDRTRFPLCWSFKRRPGGRLPATARSGVLLSIVREASVRTLGWLLVHGRPDSRGGYVATIDGSPLLPPRQFGSNALSPFAAFHEPRVGHDNVLEGVSHR